MMSHVVFTGDIPNSWKPSYADIVKRTPKVVRSESKKSDGKIKVAEPGRVNDLDDDEWEISTEDRDDQVSSQDESINDYGPSGLSRGS